MTQTLRLTVLALGFLAAGCAARSTEVAVGSAPHAGSAFETRLGELLERTVKGSAPEAQWETIEALSDIPEEDLALVARGPLLAACRQGRGQDLASVLSVYLDSQRHADTVYGTNEGEEVLRQCRVLEWTPRPERVGFVATRPGHYAVVSEERVTAQLVRVSNGEDIRLELAGAPSPSPVASLDVP